MDSKIKLLIEKEYGFSIAEVIPAPRQFVAETWFIQDVDNQKYFLKIVDKELFIAEIIASLPVLKWLHDQGMERINYPINTKTGSLYLTHNNLLIVLFNFIDANQSYDYNESALGELLASIHIMKPDSTVSIPEENYEYSYKEQFERQFNGIFTGKLATDAVLEEFHLLLKKHENRIRSQYARLDELKTEMRELDLPKVITHGDAGGNVLVRNQKDIYIIDWDGVLLAPAERDTWVPTNNFIEGYNKIIPGFKASQAGLWFYTVMYYFRSMAQYMGEIISDKPVNFRRQNLHDIEHELFNGWMVEYLKKAGA